MSDCIHRHRVFGVLSLLGALDILSQTAGHVHLPIRGEGLEASLSDYLVQRIQSSAKITLQRRSEIVQLDGNSVLRKLTCASRIGGGKTTRSIGNVFVMIGAHPNTEWFWGVLDLDEKGFIRTGSRAGFLSTCATSLPGVFAVGDVRASSVKRVASAAGEGSVAISERPSLFRRT